MHHVLTPAKLASTPFTYSKEIKGCDDIGWLVKYRSVSRHTHLDIKYQQGLANSKFVDSDLRQTR